MANVIEVNTLDQLASYRLVWSDLFGQTRRASFFHTYDWLVTFWRHAGERLQKMRILIVKSDSSTIGILPLCVINEPHRVHSLNVLTYPLSDWGVWYGPIGPNPSATMFMAIQHLSATPRDWDAVDLRWTPRDSVGSDATGRAMASVGWQPAIEAYQQTSLIQLEGLSWDDYLATRTKKWRHEVRRQCRALSRAGTVELVRHRPQPAGEGDGDPNWPLFDTCVEISRGSWQAEVQSGNTLCHADVLDFLTDCHAKAARLGFVDMMVLKLDGRPMAFQYNYHYRGSVFGLRMGYRQECRSLGVGKVLFARMLEDSIERGDHTVDMGPGDYDFKCQARTGTATSWRYAYYPWNSWRSHSVRLTRWIHHCFAGSTPEVAGKDASA